MLKGIVIALLFCANLLSFLLMGYDKDCARKDKWRVSEKTLFLAAGCFGALGGIMGMHVFHHKTKHWTFRVFFPAMLAAQIALTAVGIQWMM